MARPSADYDIRTKTARARLTPRAKPYFRSIAPNRSLGYLRTGPGAGRWIVREWLGARYKVRAFAHADDVARADGRDVLTYEQATQQAFAPAATAPVGKLTVAAAIDRYIEAVAARSKHSAHYRAMADNNIVPILGDVRIDRLTKTQIEKWQAGLVRDDDPNDPDARRRSQDSTNRLLTILKAALNGAFADEANGIATDAAWRRVKAFRNVGRAREDDLAPADARALIAKAKRIDASLATLIEAGYLTGARPGELRDLNVGDLDGATLRIRDGKTGRRLVTLNAECAAFLKRAAGNRAADAPLLPTLNGQRWDLHDAHRPLKAALDAAGLPDTVSLYTARHAHISRSIEAGMPLSLIAENCGTSLTMIERNYAKVLAHTRRDTVERTAPKLRGKA